MPDKLFAISTAEVAERLRLAPELMDAAPRGSVEIALLARDDQERASGDEERPHSDERAEDG